MIIIIKYVTKEMAMKNPNLMVPIAFNDVFQEVFGKEENSNLTAILISALLDIPYDDVKDKIIFKNSKLNKINVNSKKGIKDVVFIVDIQEPLKISLEMNKYNINDIIILRNLYYHSDTFSSSLKEQEGYGNIPKTIQFNFNPDFVDNINKPLYDEYYYTNKYGYILSSKNIICHINVAKMSEMWYNDEYKKVTSIPPIIFLFSAIIVENEKTKFKELLNNKLLNKKIGEQLERIVYNMNEDNCITDKYYDFETEQRRIWKSEIEWESKKAKKDGYEQGLKQGIEEGIEQGIEQGIEKVIMNMLNNDLDLDTISKYTLLPIDSIKKIINNK